MVRSYDENDKINMDLFKLYGIETLKQKELLIKINIVIAIIIFLVVVVVILINTYEMKSKYNTLSISGRIDKIEEKGSYMEIISGNESFIFYYYHDRVSRFLKMGDSVVKVSGNKELTIFRNLDSDNPREIILNPKGMKYTEKEFSALQ